MIGFWYKKELYVHLEKENYSSNLFQAQCQSLKINNCPHLVAEFGEEAVRRDNICKTQCSFVLDAPIGTDPNFFLESDTLQAPGKGTSFMLILVAQYFCVLNYHF
jgi:hypothetical protein